MKIKRIILTALCLILAVFALVSCEEDIIEESKEPLDEINSIYKPVVLEKATIDLYIITDAATTDNAITTVSKSIQEFLDDREGKKYDTTLNIHYIKGDIANYKTAIASVNSGIVLIAGSDMFNELVEGERLADLNSYFTDAELKAKLPFATLNRKINKNLLDAALTKVPEEVTNEGGATETIYHDYRYMIPNDHVIGSYDYVVINKEAAKKLYFSIDELKAMTTYESTKDLRDAFAEYAAEFEGMTVDDLVLPVSMTSGLPYEAKAEFESEGYICNISACPIATQAEAAQSGFGVLSGTTNVTAAMEIIYLLNTDETFRNLLQYGNVSVNYRMNGDVVEPYTNGENVYKMDLNYTGNMFLGYYCETEGWVRWNADIVNNGKAQNAQSNPSGN